MSGRGEVEVEKWRNGVGESMEKQEAAGTGRMYGQVMPRGVQGA